MTSCCPTSTLENKLRAGRISRKIFSLLIEAFLTRGRPLSPVSHSVPLMGVERLKNDSWREGVLPPFGDDRGDYFLPLGDPMVTLKAGGTMAEGREGAEMQGETRWHCSS